MAIPAPHDAVVITEVKLTLQEDGALRAFATITFNDCFVVRGLKVIEGMKGRFVAMPSRQRRDGSHQDVAHPINKDFRGYLEATVLSAYAEEVGEEMELGAESGREGLQEGI